MDTAGARPASHKPRTWWRSMLDGSHPWGSFDAMIGRYGLRRYRLTVFPPGIAAADRRLLRAWRGWPVGGAVVALLAAMLLGDALRSPMTTLLVCAAAYVGVAAVLFAASAQARAQVRSLSVIVIDGYADRRTEAACHEWEALVEMLTTADARRELGESSAVEHEAVWWQAYIRLEVAAGVWRRATAT